MIFLSYARTPTETALAEFLEGCLEAQGLQVWRDKSDLRLGDVFPQEIEQAITSATHLVFLVSNSWLDRKWCQHELSLALRYHGTSSGKLLPVLRAPFERLRDRIPVAFENTHSVVWLEDEPDPCRQLCDIHMSVTGVDIAPAQRADHGRALVARAGLTPPGGEPAALLSEDPPSLRCNRTAQWQTIEDVMANGRSDVVLVPGARGEYHEHFLQRVERQLATVPERSVVGVKWRRRPVGRDEFLGAVAAALGTDTRQLPLALHERLAHKHVVLIHECLRSGFDDEDVLAYYAEWLPALVAQSRGKRSLKCVQAIEWPRVSLIMRLIPFGTTDDDEQGAARAFMKRLKDGGVSSTLATVATPELLPITAEDVRRFCDHFVDPPIRDELFRHVWAGKRRTSEDVLRSIDKYLKAKRRPDEHSTLMAAV